MIDTSGNAPRPALGGRDRTWVAAVAVGLTLIGLGVSPLTRHSAASALAVLCGSALMAVGFMLRGGKARRSVDRRLRAVEQQLFSVDLRLMRTEGVAERNSECLDRVLGVVEAQQGGRAA